MYLLSIYVSTQVILHSEFKYDIMFLYFTNRVKLEVLKYYNKKDLTVIV